MEALSDRNGQITVSLSVSGMLYIKTYDNV
jgi:hypothetical protein